MPVVATKEINEETIKVPHLPGTDAHTDYNFEVSRPEEMNCDFYLYYTFIWSVFWKPVLILDA